MRFLYISFVQISLFFFDIALKIKSKNLCALIIFLNIRKFKEIKYKKKIKKRFLVFPKVGGDEDLIQSFKNKKSNIEFFILPRIFPKKIFNHYFEANKKNIDYVDYFTKPRNNFEKNSKKLFINFLSLVFKKIDSYFKFEGIISFNIFYFSEKYFDEVCKNLNKKFIVLHKESCSTPIEEKNAVKIYQNQNEKSLAYKISVYSKSQKKILIKSKIVTEKQITITGCPRSDLSFELRKIKPKNKLIVYYLIETNRAETNILSGFAGPNWNKLHKQTLEYIIKFAKLNPQIKIILKGKIGVHKKEYFNLRSLPKNCTFIEGGPGENLLVNASAVIALNSTVTFQAIAGNRNLIIPNFNNENIKSTKYLMKCNKKYLANSKLDFNNKLNFYLKSKYRNKNLSNVDKDILGYYLGNHNNSSGKKMREFLNRVIK